MARSALPWTAWELAGRARVSRSTINNFELGRTEPNPATLTVIHRALEAAGVEFLADRAVRPLERPAEAS